MSDNTMPVQLTQREREFLVDVMRSCEYRGNPDTLAAVLKLIEDLTKRLQTPAQQ